MKKLFLLLATAFVCFACTNTKDVVTVTVSNPLAMERSNEMVEVAMSDIANQLKLADTAQIVVLNADGQQVPYQITYDEKVIFPASVAANGTAVYTIQAGTPEAFAVKACGRYYPERVDDVAWENDLVAFRAYGPALQKTGERAFGYDVWTKYNTTEPVVEARYAGELNPETKHPVIALMPDQEDIEDIGGTLRLGSYPCILAEGSRSYELFGKKEIHERHRHRYEVNNAFRKELQEKGMNIVGTSPDNHIVEMIEIAGHPFYVGTQAHPEFKSRPNHAHPLFRGFIQAAVDFKSN